MTGPWAKASFVVCFCLGIAGGIRYGWIAYPFSLLLGLGFGAGAGLLDMRRR